MTLYLSLTSLALPWGSPPRLFLCFWSTEAYRPNILVSMSVSVCPVLNMGNGRPMLSLPDTPCVSHGHWHQHGWRIPPLCHGVSVIGGRLWLLEELNHPLIQRRALWPMGEHFSSRHPRDQALCHEECLSHSFSQKLVNHAY